MNIVEMYKTTDDKIFEDKTEALDHQVGLDRRKALEEWAEERLCFSSNFSSDVVNTMLEDSATLSEILA